MNTHMNSGQVSFGGSPLPKDDPFPDPPEHYQEILFTSTK